MEAKESKNKKATEKAEIREITEIEETIDNIKFRSGYNLGCRLGKYKNSKKLKEILDHLSQLNKDDRWAIGVANGFEAMITRDPSKRKWLNELDVIFKDKEKDKQQDLER